MGVALKWFQSCFTIPMGYSRKKSKQGVTCSWNFQAGLKKEHVEIPGRSVKKEVEFPGGSSRKKLWNFQRSWNFLVLEFPRAASIILQTFQWQSFVFTQISNSKLTNLKIPGFFPKSMF